jgi:hypothetical protein
VARQSVEQLAALRRCPPGGSTVVRVDAAKSWRASFLVREIDVMGWSREKNG